jgi:hypothetical protein
MLPRRLGRESGETASESAPELASDLAAAADLSSSEGAAAVPVSTTDLEDSNAPQFRIVQ